jgi:hypothetical protein
MLAPRGNQLPECQVSGSQKRRLVDRLLMQTRPRCGDRLARVNYDAPARRGQESFVSIPSPSGARIKPRKKHIVCRFHDSQDCSGGAPMGARMGSVC